MEERGVKVAVEPVRNIYEMKKESLLFTISQLERAANALSNVFENFSKDVVVKETLEGCFNSTQIKLLTSQCDIRNLLAVMHKRLSDFEIDRVIELDKNISEYMRKEEGNDG